MFNPDDDDEDYSDIKDSHDGGPDKIIIRENKEDGIEKGQRNYSENNDNSKGNNDKHSDKE